MNADAFRHLYAYHMAENRLLWRVCSRLPDEVFEAPSDYSHGSIRNQLVHLMEVDEGWFNELRGMTEQPDVDPATTATRDAIRARWDATEADMQAWLDQLTDERLPTRPLPGEDAELPVWLVLIHVMNHATDHRAQVYRLMHDLGAGIGRPQDYAFYGYEHPAP